MHEFIKLDISTPQNTKIYSLGIVFGRSNLLAITPIIIPSIALVTEESTEAAICKPLVKMTVDCIPEQRSLM
jgi:hypothetical protein